MKNLLFALILLFTYPFAHAQLTTSSVDRAGFDHLTESEKAEIIKQIADRKAAKSAPQAQAAPAKSTTEQVNDWLSIGERIGKGMAGAAREMGVAVNEFALSPVGMWTIALITWHYVGGALVHIGGALMVWIIGFSVLFWVARRRVQVAIQYQDEGKDVFGRSKLKSIVKSKLDDDTTATILVSSAVLIGLGCLILFTI